MKTFTLSSETQQSLLLVFLFLALLLSLFLLLIVFGNHHDRRKRYLNVSVFLALFALLIVLADDFEHTDILRIVDMRAGAQFLGNLAHGYDADFIAVFFIKQRDRAGMFGFFNRHDFGMDRKFRHDKFVDQRFDFL